MTLVQLIIRKVDSTRCFTKNYFLCQVSVIGTILSRCNEIIMQGCGSTSNFCIAIWRINLNRPTVDALEANNPGTKYSMKTRAKQAPTKSQI